MNVIDIPSEIHKFQLTTPTATNDRNRWAFFVRCEAEWCLSIPMFLNYHDLVCLLVCIYNFWPETAETIHIENEGRTKGAEMNFAFSMRKLLQMTPINKYYAFKFIFIYRTLFTLCIPIWAQNIFDIFLFRFYNFHFARWLVHCCVIWCVFGRCHWFGFVQWFRFDAILTDFTSFPCTALCIRWQHTVLHEQSNINSRTEKKNFCYHQVK